MCDEPRETDPYAGFFFGGGGGRLLEFGPFHLPTYSVEQTMQNKTNILYLHLQCHVHISNYVAYRDLFHQSKHICNRNMDLKKMWTFFNK